MVTEKRNKGWTSHKTEGESCTTEFEEQWTKRRERPAAAKKQQTCQKRRERASHSAGSKPGKT